MYVPNLRADARAVRLIRCFLCALLAGSVLAACTLTPPSQAHSTAGETATPTRLTARK